MRPAAAALTVLRAAMQPMYLRSVDGHMAWANDAARRLCGVHALTPDPRGGELVRHADGHPTGLLKCAFHLRSRHGQQRCDRSTLAGPDLRRARRDEAMRLVSECMPALTVAQKREAVLDAAQLLLSHGAPARPAPACRLCIPAMHVTRMCRFPKWDSIGMCPAALLCAAACCRVKAGASPRVHGSQCAPAAGRPRRRDDGDGHGLRAAVGRGVLGGPTPCPGAAGRRGAAAAAHPGLPAAARLVTPARGPAPAPGMLAAPSAGQAGG